MLDNVRAEYKSLQNVIKKLNEKVRFLEGCLDRKEKLNEKYRKEIEKLKSTYVYDAKQVRDIC
jgi:peptidoglycan hydrolase CwlO-like protein